MAFSENTRQLAARITALVLLPLVFLLFIVVGIVLVVAIVIDIIQLIWGGSESAVRWVLGFVMMILGNIKWIFTGEGHWSWWPEGKAEMRYLEY